MLLQTREHVMLLAATLTSVRGRLCVEKLMNNSATFRPKLTRWNTLEIRGMSCSQDSAQAQVGKCEVAHR